MSMLSRLHGRAFPFTSLLFTFFVTLKKCLQLLPGSLLLYSVLLDLLSLLFVNREETTTPRKNALSHLASQVLNLARAREQSEKASHSQ